MGFGHVCHLFRASPLATSWSHSSWAGSCEGWEELARKERCVTATGTTKASQSEYFKCSLKIKCSWTNAVFHQKKGSNTRSADHPPSLFSFPPRPIQQHGEVPTPSSTGPGSPQELGHILQPSLPQNCNKSVALPHWVQMSKHPNSKSTLTLEWCLLKKIKQLTCHKVRDKAQYSVKSLYLKARTFIFFF